MKDNYSINNRDGKKRLNKSPINFILWLNDKSLRIPISLYNKSQANSIYTIYTVRNAV